MPSLPRHQQGLPEPLERWRHDVALPEAFLLLNFLGEISRRVSSSYGTWLRSYSIDFSEYVVLWALRLLEPRSPSVSDLRSRVVMSSGGIALALNRLDTKRLVRRKPSAQDGRAVIVHLTPKGRRLIDQLMVLDAERHEQLLEGLGGAERVRVLDGLAEILQRHIALHP